MEVIIMESTDIKVKLNSVEQEDTGMDTGAA